MNLVSALGTLVKSLKDVKDPVAVKEVAQSLKALTDITGTDVTIAPEVQDLYETVVASQIQDLKKATLTQGQQDQLTKAEVLYSNQKYQEALEIILLINH